MGLLLAVDPGIRGCGAALFNLALGGAQAPQGANHLLRAAYVRNPARTGNGPRECLSMADAVDTWLIRQGPYNLYTVHEVVIEWPQVYRQGNLKGDPGDLLPLVGVGVGICARAPVAVLTHYLPKQWKGQMSKETCGERIVNRLSAEEMSRVEQHGEMTHNILDAIGIGLHHLGRFSPRRVIAR